jgi:hypothetical protein
MGYSLVAGFSRVEMRKDFRTINVQWIGQWGLFGRCGSSWNQ